MEDYKLVSEVKESIDRLEIHLKRIEKTMNNLIECIYSYDAHVKEACVLWRKQQKESLGLSNVSFGLPDIDDEAIVVMSKQGLSINAQARKLNCNRSTILNHRKKLKEQGRL